MIGPTGVGKTEIARRLARLEARSLKWSLEVYRVGVRLTWAVIVGIDGSVTRSNSSIDHDPWKKSSMKLPTALSNAAEGARSRPPASAIRSLL